MRMTVNNVDKIYKYCRDNDIKMLSNFDADFWEVYTENYEYFDRLFWRTYKSFVPYGLIESEDDEELCVEWIYDVIAFLEANEKRYSELWRLQEINDIDYNILDNYNVTETHTSLTSGSSTDNIGAKTETKSGSTTVGGISVSDSNSYIHGARSETDSETLNYGEDVTTTEVDLSVGQQQNTSEDKVSAFNESSYSPKEYVQNDLGSRHDTTETVETRDEHTDSKSGTHTENSYTDSETKSHSIGSHTDSETGSIQHSAQSNTHSNSESENKTITKKGNMGIYSYPKLLNEHKELWESFNFYKLIFDEIAEQFLRIVYF